MTQVKTLFNENNGIMYEARISKQEHSPYFVEYFANGKLVKTESLSTPSLTQTETAINNWFKSMRLLNG
jgi:hypothetical protein